MKVDFMREAIRMSLEMMQQGEGGPFGALVVRGEEIIGRGWNQVTSANDPTAHAEIVAIREACRKLGSFRLEDCELYASCEPCPMCLSAIYWARIGKFYYAATRQDAAEAGFDDDWLYRELALPAAQRTLKAEQISREEALAAFAEWKAKTDRIVH